MRDRSARRRPRLLRRGGGLERAGHEVRLWRRDAAALKPVLDSGGIKVTDIRGSRAVPIARRDRDLAAAVRGAQLVLIPSPATAQDDIARALAPHLATARWCSCRRAPSAAT